jgi:hypothetical protein
LANGKLIYQAPVFHALNLSGQYAYLPDDDTLDVGTSDFSFDALVRIDGGSGNWAKILSKYNSTEKKGWMFKAETSSKYLLLQIDNGSGTLLNVQSSNNSFALGTWYWLRVECDRDALAVIYLNGSAVTTGSIAGRQGSLDNSGALEIGYGLAGAVGFARLDKGRLLGANWTALEWQRMQAGWPRNYVYDFAECWNFAQTLTGLAGRTLLMSSGEPAYTTGWPVGNITVSFDPNYSFNWREGWAEMQEASRAEDGTLRTYCIPRKTRLILPFNFVTDVQKVKLEAAWLSGNTVTIYPDSARPEMIQGWLTSPPEFTCKTLNAAGGGMLWDVDLEIEEI